MRCLLERAKLTLQLSPPQDWVDEQEDENEPSEATAVKRQKRKERLTTAERNKRRRKNQEKFERQVELRKQSVLKGIDK